MLASSSAWGQLTGTYTIDPNGSGSTNYTSFTAAVSALTTSGISGNVTFNVKQGTYNEQVNIGSISGTSAAAGVTFQSDPTNTSTPILTYAPTSSSANYTLRISGSDYVTFDGLVFSTLGSSYARVLDFTGTSSNITFNNNTFNGDTVTSSSSYYSIIYASSTTIDTLHFTNNTFNNGSRLMYFYGSSSNMSEDFKFTGNTVTGFISYGVYTYYVAGGEISNNTFTQNSTTSSYGYAINARNLVINSSAAPDSWTISNNELTMTQGYGIRMYYAGGVSATSPSKVYNNSVVFNGTGTSSCYGLYMYHSPYTEVYNNTVRTAGSSNYNRGIYTSASTSSSYPQATGLLVYNNVFAHDVSGFPAYYYISSSFSSSYVSAGNNVYYAPSSGNQGYYWGTSSVAFAAYQTASGDSTSIEADPIFLASGDWHVEGLSCDAGATVVSYITTDLDGDTRSTTTPDIGADEFTPPACASPSGLTMGIVTPTSAACTWLGNAAQYDLEWGPTGFTIGTGSTMTVSTTAATLTVSPATTYDVYVRSNCTSTSQGYSSYSGPYTFTTPCLTQTMPVTEGFSSWVPACWSVASGSKPWNQYSSSGVDMARANYWSNNNASYILESPQIALTSNAQIEYDWSHSGQYATSYPYDSLTIRIRSVNSTTWTNLYSHVAGDGNFSTTGATISTPASTLDHGMIMVPSSFTGDTVIVQFYGWSDWGPDCFLDNIEVKAQPACPPPTNVSAFGVQATSANITFTPGNGNTSYSVAYGPCGFTPGTGATVSGTNDTIALTSLSANTCYDVYIAAYCGTGGTLGPWSQSTSFTTPCLPTAVPWTEGFENTPWVANSSFTYNADVFSTCWSRTPDQYTQFAWLVRTGTTPSSSTGPGSAHAGSNYLYTEGSFGSSGNYAELRFPTSYKTGNGAFQVSFMYHAYGQTMDSIFVEYSDDGASTWNNLGTLYQYQTANGDPYEAFNGYPSTTHDTIDVRIRVRKGSSFYNDFAIDDVSVTEVTCPTPTVTVGTIGSTTVAISWVNAFGTSPAGSKVVWGPQGYHSGTGSPTVGASGSAYWLTTSSYTITNLSPNTNYDIYVIDSCGANDFSGWATATAKTNCLAALSGAYTIDPNGTGTNNFATLDSAIAELNGCGISGPVTFTLSDTIHSTVHSIGAIVGVSSTNTVTFQGHANGGSVIEAALGGTSALTFDGASYVTVKDLTLNNQNGNTVVITGGSEYLDFDNNAIYADTSSSTSSAAVAFTATATSPTSFGNNGNHITIQNNVIQGGYYGVSVNGTSTSSQVQGIDILNNDITNQYFYNVRCYYVKDVDIVGNTCHTTRASGGYGIYMGYIFNCNVDGNDLTAKTYALYAFYLNYQKTGASPQSNITNNFCNSGGAYGAYFSSPRNINMYNNTYVGSTYGAYLYSSTSSSLKSRNWDIRNNIFKGGSMAVYAPTQPDTLIDLNYNIYNSGGSNLANWGGNQASLSAWQTSMSSFNANSSDASVIFMASDDLHMLNAAANNVGTPISTVTVDIDGDTRSATTPDIGADEYTPVADDAKLVALIGVKGGCGDSTTAISAIIENLGTNAFSNLPITVEADDINGNTTTFSATYGGPLSSMGVDTVALGTLNTYAGNTYDFLGYTQLANDGRTNNDSISVVGSVYTSYEPVPVVAFDTVCASVDSVTLSATPIGGTQYGWYDSISGGSMLATGDDYTVSTAGQSTYYLAYQNTADSLAAQLLGGNGQVGNAFNIINTSGAPLTITGFSQGPASGNTSVTGTVLQAYYTPGSFVAASSSSWVSLGTATVNLTANAATGYIPVSVTIPTGGTYGFYVGRTSGSVQYTNGSGTPGVTPWASNNDLTITEGKGGSFPNPTFSPRNWNGTVHYGSAGCSDIRVPVGFAIDSSSALAVINSFETDPATGLFDFWTAGSNGHVFTWNFDGSATASGDSVQNTFSTAGVYTVTLTVEDTVCGSIDSTSVQITSHVGVDEYALNQLVSAYPNPTTGKMVVLIEGQEAFDGKIQLIDGVGRIYFETAVSKQSGRHEVPVDLSNYAKGVYTIRIVGVEGEQNLRVVLQ